MPDRPLHMVVAAPGDRLTAALAAALDGTGPAICPVPGDLPEAVLAGHVERVAPTVIDTPGGAVRHPAGRPVAPDTAVVIATSGSSGRPKPVELTAAALIHSAAASRARIGAGPGERWLCCLPTGHVGGLQVLVRALLAGTDPVIQPRFSPAGVAEARADHVSLVPTQLRRLLAAGTDLTRFRAILLGGAAAAPDLLAAARAAGGNVVTTYGMTETCGGCVYDGRPLEGVEVDVDGRGRVSIAGPVLFARYRLMPRETAAARSGRWYRTTDLGRLDPSGRLEILGRADDVINTGGEKVAAGEVGRVLAGHPSVAEVVVVGRADPQWGERVSAVVVPADPADPPTLDDLAGYARDRLPRHALPRELEVVPAIPTLPSGKPDLALLRSGAAGPAAG